MRIGNRKPEAAGRPSPCIGLWQGRGDQTSLIRPDGWTDVLVTAAGPIIVAGPDTSAQQGRVPDQEEFVGLRLKVGAISALIGDDAAMLRDERVDLTDLLVDGESIEQVHAARALDERGAAVERLLTQSLPEFWAPDARVQAAVHALRAGTELRHVDVGISPRQLRRRFTAAVGYGPKLFERICRLDRLVARIDSTPPDRSLAEIAADCGYYDEAHLAKDTAQLAGCTPASLLHR